MLTLDQGGKNSGLSKKSLVLALSLIVLLVGSIAGLLQITSRVSAHGSGPISIFPSKYLPFCSSGYSTWSFVPRVDATHLTTNVDNYTIKNIEKYNTNLTQVYDRITHSPSFMANSQGHGWVVVTWAFAILYDRPRVESFFVLIDSDSSVFGYLNVMHNLDTGSTITSFVKEVYSGCASGRWSPYGMSLMSLDNVSSGAYLPGEPIKILVTLTNGGELPVVYTYPTACVFGYEVRANGDNGPLVYDSFKHATCTKYASSFLLRSGQTYNQAFVWNQTDDLGQQVPPDIYTFILHDQTATFSLSQGGIYIGTPMQSEPDQFHMTMSTGQDVFFPANRVMIPITLGYNGSDITSITTPSCAFTLTVFSNAGDEVYNSRKHDICALSDNRVILPPTGSIRMVFFWNKTDDNGNQVPPGNYTVRGDVTFFLNGQRIYFVQDAKIELLAPTQQGGG